MSNTKLNVLLDWCQNRGIRIDPRLNLHSWEDRQPSSRYLGQEQSDGIGVFNDSNEIIEKGTTRKWLFYSQSNYFVQQNVTHDFARASSTVVYIPKTAVLSAKSCFFADAIPHAQHGAPDAHLALALALLGELCAYFLYFQAWLSSDFNDSSAASLLRRSLAECWLEAFFYSRSIGAKSAWYGYLQSLPVSRVDIASLWEYDADNGDADSREALAWIRGTEVSADLRGKDIGFHDKVSLVGVW